MSISTSEILLHVKIKFCAKSFIRFAQKGIRILLPISMWLGPKCCNSQTYSKSFSLLQKADSNQLIIMKYGQVKTDTINVSDLTLIDKLMQQENVNVYYDSAKDYRVFLLSNGYAKLKNIASGRKEEILAQAKAKDEKIGLWFELPPSETINPVEENKETTGGISKNTEKFLLWLLGFLGLSGIVGIVRFLNARRLKLLILGEMSTGKTALYTVLVNPQINRDAIIGLTTSSAINSSIKKDNIRCGKYEIIPTLTDVPGTHYDAAFENIVGNLFNIFWGYKKYAVILTVAPLKHNGNKDIEIDIRYIDVQFGLIKAYLGAISSKKSWRKPKIIILFISKFDLFSKYSAEDSAGIQKKNEMKKIFQEHVMIVENEAKKMRIPSKIIVGSAANHWNTDSLLTAVTNSLYLNRKHDN